MREDFQKIKEIIDSNKIVLFMKGTPKKPYCGFSHYVSTVLCDMGVEFKSVNILASQELRQSVKEFSDWPTYPQLYVDGSLIGGYDIIKEMNDNDNLKAALKQ